MSASGIWCALILLTFTQDSLAGHREKVPPQIEKPAKECLRHQQNHRSTALVDRKLVDPTGFRAAEARPTITRDPIAAVDRSAAGTLLNRRPITAYESRLRRAESHPAEVSPTSTRHSAEIAALDGGGGGGGGGRELRAVETRPQTAEGRHSAEEVSPTGIRPMEILWTERIEQVDMTSIERSQIRHGRSRSHFARQKIEDSARDPGSKDGAVNRIKPDVRGDHENHFKARQVEKVSDFLEGSVSPRRNHSWLLERNFSKDNSVNIQSLDRIENNVSEGLESLLKLYQGKRGSVTEENSAFPLTRNLSWLIEPNISKDNANSRSADQVKDETRKDTLKMHYSENHGVLRSTLELDSLKSSYKNDPMSKLRKAMSLNKTVAPAAATTDRNTTETFSIDTLDDTSESIHDLEEDVPQDVALDYASYEEPANVSSPERPTRRRPQAAQVDIVTRFLRIIENQHTLGENCTAGTDLNLGEGVVDQYAQERFRLEAEFAVNRANMLTRLWKYAPEVMLSSEYLLHASVLSMVEFDEDIFAAGNCYDKLQYRDRWLYCPFAHRLPNQDGILVKDLAIQYKYLSNSSEWFYIARKNAERVIASYEQFSRGFHTYRLNESAHTEREEDEILTVKYEDGRWSKPYYDCGGGNIWMLTYTVPFFGYINDTYFFKGTSGIDIDLRRVDIDQCPLPAGSMQLNIFAASDKCKKRTTECIAIPGLGFRRGSYRCVCKRGFYYPDTKSDKRYYNGTVIEEEYERLMMGEKNQYAESGVFECLPCAEGCESCEDGSPCVVSLNWLMRTAILILECCIIACLPAVALFTWKYGHVKVVRAASPVLLRVIVLGAFFIYCTTIVMYPRPNIITCTVRVWLREIGFSLTYGALMLKTWRISVIFRVKSAKAVKITDASLLKRLGIIVLTFSVFLSIRTLVAPPVVIVARTADDLKAYLCRTDWWDHSFTTLEVMFLVWGIRLCIVVRKTPSEFNESRFISMAIYNEFLLSVFLNVSMLFLQSPANPDLLYIIFFCHTQLTVTLLLCLIFGSKAYVVFRDGGKEETIGKLCGATGKFLGKSSRPQGTSNQTNSISLQQGNFAEESDSVTDEFRRLLNQLEVLKEKNILLGNQELSRKLAAMLDASNRVEAQVSTIQAISTSIVQLNDLSKSTKETNLGQICQEQARAGNSSQGENRCRACIEKNGLGGKDVRDTSKDNETPESKKIGKDIAVSTSSKHATEDISKEVCHGKDSKETDLKDKSRGKSGHARTHAIVINLDDKSRFSEEVTV
ncbi:probable G-protein coupled receptor 158 [Monomorium pharaonis]|uniref:probable G-protein coupled receptor 158 n=1 Tax=Monomorium pharaonis TaxID=307658 RepID=UPI00174779D9|nr:probable G-protein coupled receptor 158 [Monomorium pharaonis]XP_036142326.1 probable G-protein coupled receptor 158 [Monomorium pharaonis]XP_036142327.1 probable G-protein coupled receptor 158 [Monomorium pharaonis]